MFQIHWYNLWGYFLSFHYNYIQLHYNYNFHYNLVRVNMIKIYNLEKASKTYLLSYSRPAAGPSAVCPDCSSPGDNGLPGVQLNTLFAGSTAEPAKPHAGRIGFRHGAVQWDRCSADAGVAGEADTTALAAECHSRGWAAAATGAATAGAAFSDPCRRGTGHRNQ